VALLATACGAADLPVDRPVTVRGVQFLRKLIQSDSVMVAQYGQIIAVIRRDSDMVILTNADLHLIAALPGVGVVCQSLGTDSTAKIEV
jgi:hypothetical protein